MSFEHIPLEYATRLINHGPTVYITSRSKDGSVHNIMAAAWTMPVESDPPRIAIEVSADHLTRDLIRESGVFGICISDVSGMDGLFSVGSMSGREGDKFKRFGLDKKIEPLLNVPVTTTGTVAWLSCELIAEPGVAERYDTLYGEVVAVAVDPRVFVDGHWRFDNPEKPLQFVHHLGGGSFLLSGETKKATLLD